MTIFSLSILLPIAFFVLFVLHGAGAWREEGAGRDWRYTFLVATVVWGVILALSTELLSLFNAMSRFGVALVWLLALAGLFWWSGGFGRIPAALHRLRQEARGLGSWQRALLTGLAAICGLLFAVAWVSPPNNVDSLLYHMPRVMHWAQNGSVAHYPAVFHHQLHMPPWSEHAILHLRLLFGDDRPAELVQWFSYVASVIGVSAIAAQLGVSRRGQILAMAFSASVPMAILQATSTQNDLVLTLWVVCAAYFAVCIGRDDATFSDLLGFAGAFGLGALTKATFLAYGPPLAALLLFNRWRRNGTRAALATTALILGATAIVNVGYWSRNVVTFGGPVGSPGFVRENLGTSGVVGTEPWLETGRGMGVEVLARELRAAGRNLITPFGEVNAVVRGTMARLPGAFGTDYLETHRDAAWNHEDTAGNPLHFAAIIFAFGIMAVEWLRERKYPPQFGLSVVAVAGVMSVPVLISHGDSIWSVRFQLPFFVLGGAIFAASVRLWTKGILISLLGATFLVTVAPYLLLNNMRPVVGMPPWPTRTESVFVIPKQEVLLAIAPHAVDDYAAAARRVEEAECESVGLAIGSRDLEYAFWWLLDAPQSGVRMEVINPSPKTARYVDPEFEPCAVLCTRCGAVEDRLESMNYEGTYDNFDLYLAGSGG